MIKAEIGVLTIVVECFTVSYWPNFRLLVLEKKTNQEAHKQKSIDLLMKAGGC